MGTALSIRLTVDHAMLCTAQFGPSQQRLLSITVTGDGLVRDDPSGFAINCRQGGSQADCQEPYTDQATVTLRATPDSNQRFVGWTGDCSVFGTTSVITLLMYQNFVCTATFVPPTTSVLLTVNVVNGGTGRSVISSLPGIACSGPESDCTESYPLGTGLLLHATQPVQWAGCDELVDVSYCSVTMNQSRTVTATFPR